MVSYGLSVCRLWYSHGFPYHILMVSLITTIIAISTTPTTTPGFPKDNLKDILRVWGLGFGA